MRGKTSAVTEIKNRGGGGGGALDPMMGGRQNPEEIQIGDERGRI